jgi:hypothetical protein
MIFEHWYDGAAQPTLLEIKHWNLNMGLVVKLGQQQRTEELV